MHWSAARSASPTCAATPTDHTVPGLIAATLGGLIVLAVASDHFVLGAGRIARAVGVSPVIIGAVVIGFGTSAPELVVSTIAAAQGSLDIAVTNVVGSNIANITLVLGLAAVIAPLKSTAVTLRREAPIAAASVTLFGIVLIGGLGRAEGALLIGAQIVALAFLLRSELGTRNADRGVDQYLDDEHVHPLRLEIPRTIAGLVGTVAGAQLLVHGARGIAERAGLSEGIIGLTLVAIGTSLPEIATAVQAARRHQPGLIVGNVLGSNMFNSLAVAGAALLAGPGRVADTVLLGRAVPIMIVTMYGAWALLRTDRRLVRWEGLVLLGVYAGSVVIPVL